MVGDTDEWLHPVDDDEPGWFDAMSFTAWDAPSRVLVHTRTAITPNAPDVRATALWVTWIDGQVHVRSTELPDVPPHNWDVMEVGPVGYRMERARERWTLHLADAGSEARAFLSFDGVSPCVGWSPGAYGQRGRVSGDVQLGGRRIAFDGFGQRDHAWGPADPGIVEAHRIDWFVDGVSGHVNHVLTDEGWLASGMSGDDPVASVERSTEVDAAGVPVRFTAVVSTANGPAVTLVGERSAAPIQSLVVMSLLGPDGVALYGTA